MSTKVYVFGCRISDESRTIVEREIERGRIYYNSMIEAVNADIAGPRAPECHNKRLPGKAKRIESLARLFCLSPIHTSELEGKHDREAERKRAKTVAAKAIYRRIARVSRNVRAMPKFSAARSGCYTGTYHAVQAAFDQAMSSKRVGVWPGEPFRYRRQGENSGTTIGVHIQPSTTWGAIREGRHEICSSDPGLDDHRHFHLNLKVSKESGPIAISVDVGKPCRSRDGRRWIPNDAIVSHVMLCRAGDNGTRGKYELHVTARTDAMAAASLRSEVEERIGIDIGWASRPDGSILVTVTSDGVECAIPAYAVRMALRVIELQSERDNLANEVKSRHPDCAAKSAIGVSRWCEQHADQSESEYLIAEHALRCTQDHVRRRYQAIRSDLYRKFARAYGHRCWILKTSLKEAAEVKLKGEAKNYDRTIASCFELAQLLRNAGAVEVRRERRGDSLGPSRENTEQIKQAGESGSLLERAARKAVRKYRKTKRAA